MRSLSASTLQLEIGTHTKLTTEDFQTLLNPVHLIFSETSHTCASYAAYLHFNLWRQVNDVEIKLCINLRQFATFYVKSQVWTLLMTLRRRGLRRLGTLGCDGDVIDWINSALNIPKR